MMERFSSLVTKSRPWPVIGRTIFFTSDKNRPTRDEIYFIDFWRENLSMYRIKKRSGTRSSDIFIVIRAVGSFLKINSIQCHLFNCLEEYVTVESKEALEW